MPIHFYDAVTVGKNPAEGQILRYHSLFVSSADHELLTLAIKLREDVYVDPKSAFESDVATLDLTAGV